MKTRIWLDDERKNPPGFFWAKTVEQAQEIFKNYDVLEVSLDHDLGENELTGYDFVCWIEKKIAFGTWKYRIPEFHIHSANPVGRKNMQKAIESIERIANNG